ncbi:hypothetical protein SAMN05660649_04343 [Desulfotomaculum arcticum]|uniref:PD(D/E)XK endonuclease domain-containing protein n=1 Tax=Desulfotruncus arcticus DSM 17038 TaxID=1121424 RepID=A0A1I2YAF0_9FIRM|nr:group I intron-associated PD-(D/E)XK endonuclease [Desulfotruncus arcticus]SFH22592.1 hypothetical protein SAMN05660649_04343 [Desulfotomaculum arcticum] [Desulfotruncus arcticus DSM 17038]
MAVRDTYHIGVITERAAELEFLKEGWSTYYPTTVERCDFIAVKWPHVLRVQVKTGSVENQNRSIVAKSNRPYSKEEIDVVAISDPQNDTFYFIPVEDLNGNVIRLRLDDYVNDVKDPKALPSWEYKKIA